MSPAKDYYGHGKGRSEKGTHFNEIKSDEKQGKETSECETTQQNNTISYKESVQTPWASTEINMPEQRLAGS